MSRIPATVLVFNSQSLTGIGSTLLSEIIPIGRNEFASMQYTLSAPGLVVTATIQLLVSATNAPSYFVQPTNSSGADVGTLYQMNSNNQVFNVALPMIDFARIQIKSSTAGTITFDKVWLIFDELNN